MANRALTVKETMKLYAGHGCKVVFHDKTNYLKVFRNDTERRHWFQHCHKGARTSSTQSPSAEAAHDWVMQICPTISSTAR